MLDLEFMRLAFGAGIVVGLLAPVVGFFLVQRRMSLIGDGIGHVAFAGVAAGYLLGISPELRRSPPPCWERPRSSGSVPTAPQSGTRRSLSSSTPVLPRGS